MLGLASFLAAHPEVGPAAELLRALAGRLCDRYPARSRPRTGAGSSPTLDLRQRAVAAGALARARASRGDRTSLRVASETLGFLEGTCFRERPSGAGRQRRLALARRDRPDADEQPTDAAAFVLAFRGAYLVDRRSPLPAPNARGVRLVPGRQPPRRLGLRLGHRRLPRRTRATAAPNLNQGAESTVSFLLSLIEMLELAGEGLEYADGSTPTETLMTGPMVRRTSHRLRARPQPGHRQAVPPWRGDRPRRRDRAPGC